MLQPRWFALVFFLLAVSACKQKADSGAVPSSSASAASSTSGPGPFPAGLALVGDGPKLPKEFEDVLLQCDIESPRMWNECSHYHETFLGSRWLKDAKIESELVPLLSDSRTFVRLLAVMALSRQACAKSCTYMTDRKLAEVVVENAEKEKDDRVFSHYPGIITKIDVNATGLGARIEGIVQARPKEAALGTLKDWLEFNPGAFDRLVALANSPELEIKKAALAGLGRALSGEHRDQACDVLVGALSMLEVPVNVISYRVVEGDRGFRCANKWDQYVSQAELRVNQQDRADTALLRSLFELYDRVEATPSQKSRITALARSVAGNPKKDAFMRAAALAFAARHDPNPVSYVQPFKADPEAKVAKQARKLEKELTDAKSLASPTEPRRAPAPMD